MNAQDAFLLTAEELAFSLDTDSRRGINDSEANRRLKRYGPNRFDWQQSEPLWQLALRQLKSPIVYLLVAGAGVSLWFGDLLDAVAILAVILINGLIGFVMEFQARNAMSALKQMDVLTAKVIREGQVQEISAEELVPGDLIALEAGDVVPADARLMTALQLRCEESALTGESLPVEKHTLKLAPDTIISDRHNMIFKGTSVVNGNGSAVITATGRNTQLGIITALVESAPVTPNPLDRKLGRLTATLIWIMLGMTVVFVVAGIIQGKPILLLIETAIALAVAAIPEGLPVVAAVALSYGMLAMARRKVIIKKLSAVETLGSTSVILTDKTGTLTENQIITDTLIFPQESVKVRIDQHRLIFPNGAVSQSVRNLERLVLTGALCNNAVRLPDSWSGDPMEVSLLKLADASGLDKMMLAEKFPRLAEIPFRSETMVMGSLHEIPAGYMVCAKGSVERLLEKCDRVCLGPEVITLDELTRSQLLQKAEKMAGTGLRILAFAYTKVEMFPKKDFLEDLIYIGLAGFIDPPRTDIKGAIFACKTAGIKIAMLTGDHPHTALHIARQVGLIEEEDQQVITGRELQLVISGDENMKKRILATSVFARVSPQQKLDIAAIFQEAGEIVAMTGDGINDAPALKKADVGIAMGIRGTQVARETAGIILKDDSFASIAAAIAQGREIFRNIQQFVIYLVSCNLSELGIVTILSVVNPRSALLPLQILFLNMVTDIFPALALGLGTGDPEAMQRPPRDPAKAIITGRKWLVISAYAVEISVAVLLAVIYCSKALGMNDNALNSVAFITLTFAQLFHVFNMPSNRSGLFINEITRNGFVWLAVFLCAGLLAGVFMFPATRLVLGLTVLPVNIWLISLLFSLLPLVLNYLIRLFSSKKL